MSLAHPAWLVSLALIPALIVAAVLAARTRNRAWRALVAPRLRHSLLRLTAPLPRWIALAALLVALACMIFALSRPQGNGGTRTESVKARNIIIAFDLSRSMLVKDVSPNRLDQARAIALEMIESLPDDRIGVIAFAGTAYLVAPLTIDHAAVRETIQQLDTETIPTGGSNLAGATRLAIKTFTGNQISNGALIILSDGEEHDGDIASTALDADRAGLFVFAAAIGTTDGGLIPDPRAPDKLFRDKHGNPVHSRRHDEALRSLAAKTGGRFLHAASGAAIGPMVEAALGDLERLEIDIRQRRVSIEFYQWVLLPALLLLMLAIVANTRWRPLPPRAAIAGTASLAFILALPFLPGKPLPGENEKPKPVRHICVMRNPAAQNRRHVRLPQNTLAPEIRRHASASHQKELLTKNPRSLLIPVATGFDRIAEKTKGHESICRHRLAEGDAALGANDIKTAEAAFSAALLSRDPAVQAAAHHNLGNALIEKGWRQLSDGRPYPGGAEAEKQLEDLVAKHLAKWLTAPPEQNAPPESMRLFESVLLSWTDAARHYDSATQADPSRDDSLHNRKVAELLLDKLRDSIQSTLDAVKQQLPKPQPQDSPGQGQPQPKEGDADQKQPNPSGQKGDQKDKNTPGDEQQKQDKQGDGEKPDDNANSDKGGKKDESAKTDKGEKKNKGKDESPEERARRLLRENADFESGPLIRGRRYQSRRPDFDW